MGVKRQLKLSLISRLVKDAKLFIAGALVLGTMAPALAAQPNVVLIMTDDQGYGDVQGNQNPAIRTPNLNALASESVRFTNFHMDPTCSPSRAALLTGKHSMRAGVWHTIMGRSLMPAKHNTLAESLQSAGYKTAIFGKWHLGDNYPFRPQDQGFDEVLIHGGGGVGQTPDYWGNTQFEDTYYRNGKPEHFDKFATTVWFDGAIDFIQENHEKPFFAYISTNAPHSPWRAPEEYVKPYLDMGLPETLARFYAMITQLDDQVGRLRAELDRLGIADNTLLVFATDNGSAMGTSRVLPAGESFKERFAELKKQPGLEDWVYNNGMRGFKATVYEGGHRVPFYVHWPKGNLKVRDEDSLAAHFDLMPTLLDAAGLKAPSDIDGVSLLPLLRDQAKLDGREIIVTNQRVDIPSADRPSVVMTDRWRYVLHGEKNSVELFDIRVDPGQKRDVKAQNPQVVKALQASFDTWWTSVTADGYPRQRIIVGNDQENPVRLTGMDWMEASGEPDVPWFPGFQRPVDKIAGGPSWIGKEENFRKLPWYLHVDQSSNYKVALYLRDKPASYPVGKTYAVLDIDGERHVSKILDKAGGAEFDLPMKAGSVKMTGWFTDSPESDKDNVPAFFAYVERVAK